MQAGLLQQFNASISWAEFFYLIGFSILNEVNNQITVNNQNLHSTF